MFSISSPPDELERSYEIVVIGSGYGGSIAASRFARAGRDVCLLERGEEFLPGEYPDTKADAAKQIQLDTADGQVGSRTGLYDFKVNDDISALVGCGLGGTSLINANVVEEPKDEVFDQSVWPEELRNPSSGDFSLRDGFRRAREMLEPQPYPDGAPDLPKLEALRNASEETDGTFYRPDIAVTFEDRVNAAGVRQQGCTQCGDCVSGCNYGSKNTLLMNYLPDAWNHGAQLFTNVEVQYLERSTNGDWIIHYEVVGRGREEFDAPGDSIKASRVVLAAGSLGSTEILLRSRERGLSLSDRVGDKFSGNADVLGFAYNTDQEVRGVGMGDGDPSEMPPVGPCIAGIIDIREEDRSLEEQFVIEEGVIPGALGDVLPMVMSKAALLEGEDTDSGFGDFFSEKGRELQSIMFGSRSGAMDHTETFLSMGHDGGDGQLELQDGQLRIDWPDVGKREMFQMINETLKNATSALGGTFLENPLWTHWFDRQLMTVHPLGGCPVGNDARHGAVDHRGRVFTGSSEDPSEVYEDLMVCDGSIIPGSVGINPLLTISAMTERACALEARDHEWAIDYGTIDEPIDPPSDRPVGIRFTEKMAGPMAVIDPPESYEEAAEVGRNDDHHCKFVVTITVDDLDALMDDPAYRGTVSGTVEAAFLSDDPLTVTDGTFQLAAPADGKPSTRYMTYRLVLKGDEDETYTLVGRKELKDDFGPDIWSDTTTLFTTLYEGTVDEGADEEEEPLARGILQLGVGDLINQLQTMEATGASSTKEKWGALWRFGRVFAGTLFDMYGGISDASPPGPEEDVSKTRSRPDRETNLDPKTVSTRDDRPLNLNRWRGGDNGPVLLLHDLGFSSRLFRAERLDSGLVEYLTSEGYDVWAPDLRVSTDLPASGEGEGFDAVVRQDVPAVLEEITGSTDGKQVDVIGHGWGGYMVARFLCEVEESQRTDCVRSALFSQIATEPVFDAGPEEITGLYRPEVRKALELSSVEEFAGTDDDWIASLRSRVSGEESDGNWWQQTERETIRLLYGPILSPHHVSPSVIEAMDMMVGDVAPRVFDDLARSLEEQPVRESDLSGRPLAEVPVTFIHGRENQWVDPESTKRLDDRLQSLNGSGEVTYHLVAGCGHFDSMVGPRARREVYPLVLHHLNRSQRVTTNA